jgi:uncharacterized protein
MIIEAEIRQKAFIWGVDAMVVDLDYSLGWFLAALYTANERASNLCFKGGTCLRKCIFGDYRFSEDLDFTATARVIPDQLGQWITNASAWSRDHDGPSFEAAASRIEIINDESGRENFQLRIYFYGPLQWGGSPRAIRVDVTRDEFVMLAPDARQLLHPYSDIDLLQKARIPCYAKAEILAEKLRAVGGQRRFAVSRDLYDIHQLIRTGVTLDQVAPLLNKKFAARDVDPAGLSIERLNTRYEAFHEDWKRRLSHLVQIENQVDFDTAWETLLNVVQQIEAQQLSWAV